MVGPTLPEGDGLRRHGESANGLPGVGPPKHEVRNSSFLFLSGAILMFLWRCVTLMVSIPIWKANVWLPHRIPH